MRSQPSARAAAALAPVAADELRHWAGRPMIFDIGLNIGQDTAFYLAQGYSVVAVEADPVLAAAARKRFEREIQAGRLEIVNVGIADREGFADFWICDNKPEFNSFCRTIAARDAHSHHAIRVPVIRFRSLIEQYGTPVFLKIDIEGHDMLCLDDLTPATRPRYLSIESECPLDNARASVDEGLHVLDRLASLGYLRFKLIDQYNFCALSSPGSLHYWADVVGRKIARHPRLGRLPAAATLAQPLLNRPRLERKLGWQFPMGSSGAWGEDTPGQWIDRDAAARAYVHYRQKHFKWLDAKFHSFWCDWHAG